MLTIGCVDYDTDSGGHLIYDLVAGMFKALASASEIESFFETRLIAQDIYEIGGAEPGTLLSFTASLRVSISKTNLAVACARLTEENLDTSVFCAPTGDFETKVSIHLEHVVGEPFVLVTTLTTKGTEGGRGEVTAYLEFEGLPPGAMITSCQGFIQDFPVQVLQESWGQIKTRYR